MEKIDYLKAAEGKVLKDLLDSTDRNGAAAAAADIRSRVTDTERKFSEAKALVDSLREELKVLSNVQVIAWNLEDGTTSTEDVRRIIRKLDETWESR